MSARRADTAAAPQQAPAAACGAKRPSAFASYRILLAKDLRREFRTFDMLSSMCIYAVLVLIVYGAALGTVASAVDIVNIAGGLLWALIVFTSLLGLNRSFAHEREQGCIEGVLLVPLDRGVVFLAKATANALLLLIVELIALPLFWFFFLADAELAASAPLLLLPLAAGTIGIAGVGTLLATMTANTSGRDVLTAVLFIPLVFPLLYACVAASTAVLVGAQGWMLTLRTSLALACGYDVIMLLVSWVLYDFAVSA